MAYLWLIKNKKEDIYKNFIVTAFAKISHSRMQLLYIITLKSKIYFYLMFLVIFYLNIFFKIYINKNILIHFGEFELPHLP
jgi:hypothetical protein